MRLSIAAFLLLCLVFGTGSGYGQTQAAGPLSAHVKCYQTLRGYSQGAGVDLDDSGNILLPAKQGSDYGFYIINPQGTLFQKFPQSSNAPASIRAMSSKYRHFFYKVPIKSQSMRSDVLYVAYSVPIDNPLDNPGIVSMGHPDPSINYISLTLPSGDKPTDTAGVAELSDELLRRVPTVDQMSQARVAAEKGERDTARAPVNEEAREMLDMRKKAARSLDGCANVKHAGLQKKVAAERSKFNGQ